MKLLHLTPKKNYKSILKYGLRPSIIKNETHLWTFNDDGLVGNKAIYFWDPDKTGRTDKMVKDFIYCKHFIHPRNKIFDESEDTNFMELGDKLYGEAEDWLLLEIDAEPEILLEREYIHAQTTEGGEYSTAICMKPIYEHDDKILRIGLDIINKNRFRVVNEISTRLYTNNTIGVSYKRPLGI